MTCILILTSGFHFLQEMAVSSTTTAAAAITPLSAGSLTNLVTTNSVQLNDSATVEKRHNLLVDRLNELPEKYHHRRDSQLHLDLEMMESSPIKSGADAGTRSNCLIISSLHRSTLYGCISAYVFFHLDRIFIVISASPKIRHKFVSRVADGWPQLLRNQSVSLSLSL